MMRVLDGLGDERERKKSRTDRNDRKNCGDFAILL